MTPSKKLLVISILVGLAVLGKMSCAPIKTEVKTAETTTKVEQTKTDTDRHKETTTTETVKPDGTKETTTKVVEDTTRKTLTKDSETDKKTSDIVKDSSSKISLSLLVGADAHNLFSPPVYGLSLTKPVLGPITAGIWGLSNLTFGVSVGLTF